MKETIGELNSLLVMEDRWIEISRGLKYSVVAMRSRKIKSLDTEYILKHSTNVV